MAEHRGPIALAEKEPKTPSGFDPDDFKAIRQELSRIFGVSSHPTKDQLQSAFVDGARAVLELKNNSRIKEPDAELLLKSLATLYTSALIAQFTESLFRGGGSSELSLHRWFREYER